ncbi:site-specific integrase [Paraburkholderia sediminicola]|uniref:tyrosine-type recombinase/integrase n=1 Tax=Paraburkholderia TaxID=1822464 RepID=UPI0038B94860
MTDLGIPYLRNPDLTGIIKEKRPEADPRLSRYYVKPLILKRGVNRGERISLLMDRIPRTPVALPNEHMLDGERLLLSHNTYYRRISTFCSIYEWADSRNISIAERLRSGMGFNSSEIGSLHEHLRYRRRRNQTTKLLVGKTELRARMVCARIFATNVMRDVSSALSPLHDADRLLALDARITQNIVLFEQYTPNKEASPLKKGLSRADAERLAKMIAVDSYDNPWKKLTVRERNFVLLTLLLCTGGRRGDLAKLKVSDVVGGTEPYVRFDAHPDDPLDPRVYEPRLKTQPRDFPITAEVAHLVVRYIRHGRKQIRNVQDSEYLFLSTLDGAPLAQRTINQIFKPLQHAFPGLTPHILRHTSTEDLKRTGDSLGMKSGELLSLIMYLNGWKTDNLKTYTAREREETARRVATARQEEFYSK